MLSNVPYFLTTEPNFKFKQYNHAIDEYYGLFSAHVQNYLDTDEFVAKYIDLTVTERERFFIFFRSLLIRIEYTNVNISSIKDIADDEFLQIAFVILMQYYFAL